MYGYPPYNYGRPMRRMHVCPGCSMQVPYGMACTGCYMPWDPTAFLVAEMIEEVAEVIVEEEIIEDFGGGGYYDGDYDAGMSW
jgi:hypothetical protein